MTLGYRAVLRLPEDADAVDVAESQMRSWLLGKRADRSPRGTLETSDWDGPGRHRTGADAHLDVVHHEGVDGSRRRLLRHVETNRDGTWTVSMVAASLADVTRDAQSIVIELDVGDHDPDEAVTVGSAPNLVTNVLEAIDVRDGETDLFARPVVVSAPEVRRLVAAITDPTRTIAVVVAGMAPGAPVDAWRQAVESLLKQSRGVSTGFVLTGAAHAALVEHLPDSHAVAPMSIRTFEPGVALDDATDGLRHRVLSAGTMDRHLVRTGKGLRVQGHLPQAHARTARKRFLDRPLPVDLARTLRILSREEIRDRTSAPPLDPPGPTTVPASARPPAGERLPRPEPLPAAAVDEVWDGHDRRVLSADVVRVGVGEHGRLLDLLTGLGAEPEVSLPQIAIAEEAVRRLRGDAAASEAFLDDAEVLEREKAEATAHAALLEMYTVEEADARREAEVQVRSLRREVDWLRRRLREAERFETYDTTQDVEDEERPDDVQGLCELLHPVVGSARLTQFVVFTGDDKRAVEVDGRDTNRRYLGDLWEQVLVLFDFARSAYEGSVQQYLSDPLVTGRKVPLKRFAAGESGSTTSSPRKAGQRVFPVPEAVHVEGRAAMYAHFKPPRTDMFAPRMHYLDDTRNTGKVYIGYIGKHLDTTTKGN